MAAEDIERDFPRLAKSSFNPPRSEEDFNYNCLAFALGDVNNWWEPPGSFGYYWPPGLPPDTTVDTAVAIARLHGFVVEIDRAKTPELDSIAIYAEGKEWTHFAKFTGGVWLSKLGEGHDIAHQSLEELEGGIYGHVSVILSRRGPRP